MLKAAMIARTNLNAKACLLCCMLRRPQTYSLLLLEVNFSETYIDMDIEECA